MKLELVFVSPTEAHLVERDAPCVGGSVHDFVMMKYYAASEAKLYAYLADDLPQSYAKYRQLTSDAEISAYHRGWHDAIDRSQPHLNPYPANGREWIAYGLGRDDNKL